MYLFLLLRYPNLLLNPGSFRFPLLRAFLPDVAFLEDVVKPKGICRAEIISLLLAITVMDMLAQANTGDVTPEMLAIAIAKHYAAHVVAYGYTIFTPKFHYMMHIPSQLARFKFHRMFRPRKKTQNRQTVGGAAVPRQQAKLRADSARRMHIGTHRFPERSTVEAVLAKPCQGMPQSGGCIADMWFRIG